MGEPSVSMLEFPLKWTKCPACGSERALADMILKEEQAKGRMGKGLMGAVGEIVVPIADPRIAPTVVPVLVCIFDVCADCGTYYCRDANKVMGTPMPGQQTPARRPQPPFNP